MLLAGILVAVFKSSYHNFPISIPVWGFWSAIIVALLTGLIFGVLPARKAANLDPITALAKR
jgi:putative ABC transport system permease protein